MRVNAEAGQYENILDACKDLHKILRIIEGSLSYVFKMEEGSSLRIKPMSPQEGRNLLKSVKLFVSERKPVTLLDVISTVELSQFMVNGVELFSDDPTILSIFGGYNFPLQVKTCSSLPYFFDKLTFEGICNSNKSVYTYVDKWISYIVQNPGKKTRTALVLKGFIFFINVFSIFVSFLGIEGAGKNRWIHAICKMLSPFSEENITDIQELTGRFNGVARGKMLVVLNEAKSVNKSTSSEKTMNALKSLISDEVMRSSDKYQSAKSVTNSLNIIIVTNSSSPITIDASDRRFVVLRVSAKFKDDPRFFIELSNSYTPDFFSHLLTYCLHRDITDFSPTEIPATEEKSDLTRATMSDIDRWCLQYFNALTTVGVSCSDARATRPKEFKTDRAFELSLKDRCDVHQQRDGDERSRVYKLKPEYEKVLEKLRTS